MTYWSRRTVLIGACLMAASLTRGVFRGGQAQAADQGGDPASVIRQLYSALEVAMRAGDRTPFSSRFDTLAPAIDRVFDLEAILKASIGIKWDTMSADDRTRLERTYRTFSIVTYVANFDKYDGETFNILPGNRASGNDRIIASELVGRNGDRTRLDYLMRNDHGWHAVDVLLDGSISRVAVQRSDFRKVLRTGDADALVAMLQKKISDLSGGALRS